MTWLSIAALMLSLAWAAWNWLRYRRAVRELEETARALPGLQSLAGQVRARVEEYERLSAAYRAMNRRGRETAAASDAAGDGPAWP
jgi:hypothetical protein